MSVHTIVLRGKVLGPDDEEDAAGEQWNHGPIFYENLTDHVAVADDSMVTVSVDGAVTIHSEPIEHGGGYRVETTYPAWRVLAVEARGA